MLPKQNRLPRTEFPRVFKTGFRIHNPDITCVVTKTSEPIARFAIVVSAKVAKRAADRNRMKRLMRESVRHLLPTIKSGFDCILIAKINFSEKNELEIESHCKQLLRTNSLIG